MRLPPGADPEHENWKGVDLSPKPPVEPNSPEQQIHHLLPPDGYQVVPVLSEPVIRQPGQIAFDGDGIYDASTVFVDSLVFPRFVMPFGKGGILTMESNADNVYRYVDTDRDGRADRRELFTTDFGRSGHVEHQQASLHWGMDNWMYVTYHSFRIRWTPDGVEREETGSDRSQWGIAHDNDGKVWFQHGASGVPGYFQFPIHYGNIEVENELAEGFRVPYGAPVKLADFQGGAWTWSGNRTAR